MDWPETCIHSLFYNALVKTWDVIIIGAGIIGLSLAISLRKQGLRVLIVERGEPGREASHAAAGMLVGSGAEIPPPLRVLAEESARLYPEFVHELEDESGNRVDLRDQGTILLSSDGSSPESAARLSSEQLSWLEPALAVGGRGRPRLHESREIAESGEVTAAYLSERSVDPRARVTGVQTEKTSYSSTIVVNCAGAWAGCIAPHRFPVRPVKGQMLAVIGGPVLKHVVRSAKVYLVPRSDWRLVIGSTLEDAGYNKQTSVNTIQQLFHAAIELAPGLSESKVHEAWAGLRPGTPDDLPILGETSTSGYFIATGHFRDGILLAPVTAQVMTKLVLGSSPGYDLAHFASSRFQ